MLQGVRRGAHLRGRVGEAPHEIGDRQGRDEAVVLPLLRPVPHGPPAPPRADGGDPEPGPDARHLGEQGADEALDAALARVQEVQLMGVPVRGDAEAGADHVLERGVRDPAVDPVEPHLRGGGLPDLLVVR